MEKNEIRCGYCGKLLGKGTVVNFEIKCPRCKTINHLRAQSPRQEPHDDHPEQNHVRKH